ncbi:hypothetical protein CPC08DRAFT_810666 [Agrocybe pediades]|nr:hypothetical protein CPC08DRAFT_810666 [Agrocybe pediades]
MQLFHPYPTSMTFGLPEAEHMLPSASAWPLRDSEATLNAYSHVHLAANELTSYDYLSRTSAMPLPHYPLALVQSYDEINISFDPLTVTIFLVQDTTPLPRLTSIPMEEALYRSLHQEEEPGQASGIGPSSTSSLMSPTCATACSRKYHPYQRSNIETYKRETQFNDANFPFADKEAYLYSNAAAYASRHKHQDRLSIDQTTRYSYPSSSRSSRSSSSSLDHPIAGTSDPPAPLRAPASYVPQYHAEEYFDNLAPYLHSSSTLFSEPAFASSFGTPSLLPSHSPTSPTSTEMLFTPPLAARDSQETFISWDNILSYNESVAGLYASDYAIPPVLIPATPTAGPSCEQAGYTTTTSRQFVNNAVKQNQSLPQGELVQNIKDMSGGHQIRPDWSPCQNAVEPTQGNILKFNQRLGIEDSAKKKASRRGVKKELSLSSNVTSKTAPYPGKVRMTQANFFDGERGNFKKRIKGAYGGMMMTPEDYQNSDAAPAYLGSLASLPQKPIILIWTKPKLGRT